VPAEENRGSAVMLHGMNQSRHEMLEKLPFLHAAGWNALLYDQRLHGESGGEISSLGALEREDALVAVGLARERSVGTPVVLWGVSLGAAAATLAAADDESVAGLVCDSSFRSLRDTVRHHLGLFQRRRGWLRVVPGGLTADLTVFWIGHRAGFDPDTLDVEAAASRLRMRPALFVCNSGDRRMPQQIAFDLQTAAGDRSSVLVIPGDSHGGAWREGTAAYSEAVRQLLDEVAPVELGASDAPESGSEMPGAARVGGA
jgi:pimeloyl-ACP methyl ester carboxylesterase